MTTLDKQYVKGQYAGVSLDERIQIAALKITNGEVVSFRGASADTYKKVMQLVHRIENEIEFPQCPCGECE